MKRFASLLILSLLACNPDSVDETGYLQPPEIDTTGEAPLDDADKRSLIVVGNPGAITVPGGNLTVTASSGAMASVEVTDPSGSFVVTLDALLGDSVELHYDKDGSDSLLLDLDGTAVGEVPSCMTCLLDMLIIDDGMGNATVDLSMIDESMPPYTLMNTSRGQVVRGTRPDEILTIPASSGNTVCLYRDEATQTSATVCQEML